MVTLDKDKWQHFRSTDLKVTLEENISNGNS